MPFFVSDERMVVGTKLLQDIPGEGQVPYIVEHVVQVLPPPNRGGVFWRHRIERYVKPSERVTRFQREWLV
jgi:hypothetical protein